MIPSLARGRWTPLDGLVVGYALWVAAIVAVRHGAVAGPLPLLAFHVLVIVGVAALPPRGAPWERPRPEPSWRARARASLRFLRYTYPLLLLIPFFEEVQQTVHAITPSQPYWFEPWLYAADRRIFGGLPAVLLADWVGWPQDEVMHAFYFSYYLIIISGAVVAWRGSADEVRRPGAGLAALLTATVAAFFCSFVWYPWLPARGPWEDPELMATLPAFEGLVFTPLIELVIAHGAVSGGCFPSAHVSGSLGIVVGLGARHRQAAWLLGALTVGLSVACVYTRYHHAVDVAAGIVTGLAGGWLGKKLAGVPQPSRETAGFGEGVDPTASEREWR